MSGGDGVLLHYDDLDAVNTSLKAIVQEFKDAEGREDDLQDAIGKPFGNDKLRDRAHDFEGGWDDRRKFLCEDIEKVQQHVDGVLKGFKDWDKKTGDSEDSANSGS